MAACIQDNVNIHTDTTWHGGNLCDDAIRYIHKNKITRQQRTWRYKTIEKYPQIIYRCPPVLLARMFFSALLISFQFVDSIAKSKEMFEDSKGAIRSRKSKNDRHYNGWANKKDKRTNNDKVLFQIVSIFNFVQWKERHQKTKHDDISYCPIHVPLYE